MNSGCEDNTLPMNLQKTIVPPEPLTSSEQDRISRYDWTTNISDLSSNGAAVLEKLLTKKECEGIAALYAELCRSLLDARGLGHMA